MTSRGERFLASLKDGRSVWLDGRKVENVPAHPSLAGTLETIRRLFDLLDDPNTKDQVGYHVPGIDQYVHSSFLVPRTADDLAKRRNSFLYWARETNGVMSRLSDYARSMVTGWYAVRNHLGKRDPHFEDKITRYYHEARDRDLFLTTALLDPQIDRSQGLDDRKIAERYLHTVKKTSEGIVVRGAKMIATSAPYCHDFLIFSFQRLPSGNSTHAHALIVSANSPGLHIVCRESFADGRNRDHILSSRYDEMDAILLFDDVLIPWERVLFHGDVDAVWHLRSDRTANALAFHQTVVRFVAKLEFVAGVAFAVAEAIGVDGYLHIQEKLGELITQIETIKALALAAESQACHDESGVLVPEIAYLDTARNLGTRFYPRAIEILQQVGGSGFMQTPSTVYELDGPIYRLLRLYLEGASVGAEQKVKLFKLAWDLIGSPLGSRHELYERFYAGDPVRSFANQYLNYDKSVLIETVWKLLK